MIFYDFECYKHYWCVVIADTTSRTFTTIDTVDILTDFYNEHINDIWCGYNSKGYDQFLLKGLLLGYNPYKISDYIINQDLPGWMFCEDFKNVKLIGYDAIQRRGGVPIGLKELEFQMGLSIVECDVPFDLDRELTEAEKQSVITYCTADVEALIQVFLKTKTKFDAHIGLTQKYKLPLTLLDATDAKLTAKVLKAKKVHGRYDEFNMLLPDTLVLDKYKYIADWYLDTDNHDYNKSLTANVYGIDIDYGWGGFHAAKPKCVYEGFIVDSDIASLYPSIMIVYGLLSRNIPPEHQHMYEDIKNERIQLKKAKNPLQESLKLILNTTYGILKDPNNDMYDPNSANLVCLFGQLLMTDLIEKLEYEFGEKLTLIQVNTDGIFVKLESPNLFNRYKEVCADWCNRVGLDIEHDEYVNIVQKDVNNYLAVKPDGGLHRKGAYVKKLGPLEHNLSIVNTALVAYFTKGTTIEDTINGCDDLYEFQTCAKKSSSYKYLMYGDEKLNHKYYRIFASTDTKDKPFYKLGARGTKEKVANTPSRCFIHNEVVAGVKCPSKLDKSYYIELAYSRLEQFLGYDVRQMRLY